MHDPGDDSWLSCLTVGVGCGMVFVLAALALGLYLWALEALLVTAVLTWLTRICVRYETHMAARESDLKHFGRLLRAYAAEHGEYPPESELESVVPGLPEFRSSGWSVEYFRPPPDAPGRFVVLRCTQPVSFHLRRILELELSPDRTAEVSVREAEAVRLIADS